MAAKQKGPDENLAAVDESYAEMLALSQQHGQPVEDEG